MLQPSVEGPGAVRARELEIRVDGALPRLGRLALCPPEKFRSPAAFSTG